MSPTNQTIPSRPIRATARRDRGSTILLVVTILSLLALLAVTMTFTSRMELSSSHNYSIGVQNRVASLTGIEAIANKLEAALPPGPTSPLDATLGTEFLTRRPGSSANLAYVEEMFALSPNMDLRDRLKKASTRKTTAPLDIRPVQRSGTSEVMIFDASARVNINAASKEILSGFFETLETKAGVSINGEAIAAAIVKTRLGGDGAPGTRNVDDDLDASIALEIEDDSSATVYASLDPAYQAPSATRAREALEDVREDPALIPHGEFLQRQETRYLMLTGTDEPDEYVADIRLPAYGDDVRFSSIGDLLRQPAIVSAGLNTQILEAARPYLTIFSIGSDERIVESQIRPLVDLNRADAQEIYDALRALYAEEDKSDTLLKQFAVNIVDFRDFDDVPTLFPGTSGSTAILGAERIPFIVEVYYNAMTPDEEGDDGQFVELHNPWEKPLDVQGWELRGAGSPLRLEGRIEPNGYLILTDDIDNALDDVDDHVAGTGSLYDIFDILPDGYHRRAQANEAFSLPNEGRGIAISLHDRNGNLVDQFTYSVDEQTEEDSLYSLQRDNPMVRETIRRRATPFSIPVRFQAPAQLTLDRLREYPRNAPYVTTVDLFSVFAGYVDSNQGNSARWAFPQAVTPSSSSASDRELAAEPDVIDARVLDIFTVDFRAPGDDGGIELADTSGKALQERHAYGRRAGMSKQLLDLASSERSKDQLAALAKNLYFEAAPGWYHGRVNVNTAGETVLDSLPGIDRQRARLMVQRRERLTQAAVAGQIDDAIVYHAPSDLLVDDLLWPDHFSTRERLEGLRALLPHISLNSRAFLLVGQPRVDATSDADLQKAMRLEALVSLDRNAPEIVYWRRPNFAE